jgi:hypothetical protein
MVKRLLSVAIAGALLAGCGESDDEATDQAKAPKQEQTSSTTTATDTTPAPESTTTTGPATTEPDVPDEPAEPTQQEIAIKYSKRIRKFNKKYRAQGKALVKGFKRAQTPEQLIAVSKKYKRYLNRAAHTLAVMKPPRLIRPYHHRFIVIVRRTNGHMSIGIGSIKQRSITKLRRFETLIDRDIKKGDKAAETIDNRMEKVLLDG